jgi:hypothetical protein
LLQNIIFFISDDTFEVLGQVWHWKAYWTQGNLTMESINNIMTQQKNYLKKQNCRLIFAIVVLPYNKILQIFKFVDVETSIGVTYFS